jgi:hypothetical protein
VLTAAVEAGCSRAVFTTDTLHLVTAWQQLASFQALELQQDGSIMNYQKNKVGAAGRHGGLESLTVSIIAGKETADHSKCAVLDRQQPAHNQPLSVLACYYMWACFHFQACSSVACHGSA